MRRAMGINLRQLTGFGHARHPGRGLEIAGRVRRKHDRAAVLGQFRVQVIEMVSAREREAAAPPTEAPNISAVSRSAADDRAHGRTILDVNGRQIELHWPSSPYWKLHSCV